MKKIKPVPAQSCTCGTKWKCPLHKKGELKRYAHDGKPVELSRQDWVEISSALFSKETQIRKGDWGEGEDELDNDRWADHLSRIQDLIGDDGEYAFKCGTRSGV